MSGLQTPRPFLLVTLVGVFLLGCGQEDSTSAAAVVHSYEVRGVVRQLPRPGTPQPELEEHSE